ncbi:hypothetical protein GpartN1_g1433.t1 [Galdieria partita]|uniref:Uncharacterized protein n=1 Tax=Galdieria partita TaxID=83374 RepID=A0A9C7PU03_9RHOD|nr:hypothetical protein GpartN1_g1433.t1 [Galdieria partita]
MANWIRNSFRVTKHITTKARIANQSLRKQPIRSKSISCDRTWLAIQDYTQQRFSCRHISKRSPSISETITKNNCIVRDSGRASLATAAADSSTKGLACLETVDGAVPLAKSLSVLGIDSDVGNSVTTLLRLAHGVSRGCRHVLSLSERSVRGFV